MEINVFKERLNKAISEIEAIDISYMAAALKACKGTIYIIGNGGSAANAEHAANDFMKVGGLRAIALTAVPTLTAYANDISYDQSFYKQLVALRCSEDAVFAMSVSGTSPNIVDALYASGASVSLLLMGKKNDNNSYARSLSDHYISINSDDCGIVETAHQAICHIIAKEVAS